MRDRLKVRIGMRKENHDYIEFRDLVIDTSALTYQEAGLLGREIVKRFNLDNFIGRKFRVKFNSERTQIVEFVEDSDSENGVGEKVWGNRFGTGNGLQ